jgi:hypothetical protein
MNKQERITIACEGATTVDYHELSELQGALKNRDEADIQRMITSIRRYGFSFPFFVWRNRKRLWCLDGHGRIEALRRLESQGVEIPPVPVSWVEAKTKAEAKQKLLRLNSQYGDITQEGLAEFTANLNIDWDEISLPAGRLEPGQPEDADENYSRLVEAPIYEPTRTTPPSIDTLCDTSRRDALLHDIEQASIGEDEKTMLRLAAERHLVFNYANIAEYYAHASPETQRLFEASALVIIDIDQAIEQGFVSLTKRLRDLYEADHGT